MQLVASGVEGVGWLLVWPGRGDGHDGEQESDDGEESHFRFGWRVEGFSTGFQRFLRLEEFFKLWKSFDFFFFLTFV